MGKGLVLACACCELWSQDSKCRIFSPCNFYICGWNSVMLPRLKKFAYMQDKTIFYLGWGLIPAGIWNAWDHFSCTHPPLPPPSPPGYCRAFYTMPGLGMNFLFFKWAACGTFSCLVSPGGGALANFSLPGGQAFANPRAIPKLLICSWFPIQT